MNILFRLLCAFLLFVNLASAESNSDKLRVGVIICLSGDGAALGEAFKNGFELGLEKLNPEERAKIDVRYEDDGLSPKNTISAFNKLYSEGGLDIVISFSSGTSKPLASIT